MKDKSKWKRALPVGIIMEVVDEVAGQEVVFHSVLDPQEIQVRDCPFKIRLDHLDAIREAYGIRDGVLLRASEGDRMDDWVINDGSPMYMLILNMRLKSPAKSIEYHEDNSIF